MSLKSPSGPLSNPFTTQKIAREYLSKELLIDLRAKQDTSMATAIETPGKWLAERSAALDAILDDKEETIDGTKYTIHGLASQYQSFVASYAKLYPTDQALAMATRDIRPIFEARVRQLELEHPGSSLIVPALGNMRQASEIRSGLIGSAVTGEPISKAQYKEYRRARKAKKAAKASRK